MNHLFWIHIIFAAAIFPALVTAFRAALHHRYRLISTPRKVLNNDAMEDLLETVIFSGDMTAFVKKSSEARSHDFNMFVRKKLSDSDDSDEQQVLKEISEIIDSTQEFIENASAESVWPTEILDAKPQDRETADELSPASDLTSRLKALQGGSADDFGKVIDRLGVLDKKIANVNKSSEIKQTTSAAEVFDEGERKAREVAMIIRKKQGEAFAKAQAEAEAVAKNNREFKHF